MGNRQHWEDVYRSKRYDQVSWFTPHLEESLRLIRQLAPDRSASVIDIGGGESTLVDDLLADGYERVSVLDISQAALDFTRERLGPAAERVRWYASDVLTAALPRTSFDVWHDRAVFHFLTSATEREQYVSRVRESVKPGGFVVMATFGPDGPQKCSGLEVVRYDSDQLHGEFGDDFKLLGTEFRDHRTPFDTHQQFVYCWCRLGST